MLKREDMGKDEELYEVDFHFLGMDIGLLRLGGKDAFEI